jgi:DMSO/TMAO reductase YedYZ heme-binding membrane subunit
MEGSVFLELSNDAGLVATVILTFNFLLGMMLSTEYKRKNYWKRLPAYIRQVNVNDLHNWTAYVTLVSVLLHPVLLLFDASSKFNFLDVVFPINAPHQKAMVAFGTLAMFAIITVIITTQKAIKKKISFRAWKNIHLISYCTAFLFVIHGIMLDPQLKDKPIDFLDGEKLVPELCGLVLFIATILRYKYHLQSKKEKENRV